MNEISKKLIILNLNEMEKKEIAKIKRECKNQNIDFTKLNEKAQISAKKLTNEAQKLGYHADKKSFNHLMETYLINKNKMKEKEKKEYLTLLALLSTLYDIDIKKELEEDTILLNTEKIYKIENKIKKMCTRYYLEEKHKEKEYEKIKKLAEKNKIELKRIEENTKKYVKKILSFANKFRITPTKEGTETLIKTYNQEKKHLDEAQKLKYLHLLTILTEIYDINLRAELTNLKKQKEILLNPLENDDFLKYIIKERYTNSYFSIEETLEEKEYNYEKEQLALLKELQKIAVDNASFYPQVKEEWKSFLTCKITKKEKGIQKYLKTIDYSVAHIGIRKKTIFATPETPSKIAIYLNIPNTKEKYLLLNDYILKCIKNKINYDMWNQYKIMLFASPEDYSKKIKILKEIKQEHPEYFKNIKPFFHTASIKNSFYSISCVKLKEQYIDNYHAYFNQLVEMSYYRTLAKIVLNKMIIPEEIKIINNFINLKKVVVQEDQILFNEIPFKEIKDIVNKNIPDINKTLAIYMEQKIDLFLKEFKKSMQYIANKLANYNKSEKINIAFNRK